MPRPLALVVFLASAGLLVYLYRPSARVAAPRPAASPAKPEALYSENDLTHEATASTMAARPESAPPVQPFSPNDLEKMRASLLDASPQVRWAAAELLFTIRAPGIGETLDKMAASDMDPGLRVKIMRMRSTENSARLDDLIKGLSDADKSVRIGALKALGEIGDPSAAAWVSALLEDPESDVQIAALRTLGRFQDKRTADFRALTEQLERNYKEALSRAAEK